MHTYIVSMVDSSESQALNNSEYDEVQCDHWRGPLPFILLINLQVQHNQLHGVLRCVSI